ncbi:ATP-binding protein [Rhodoligotrophos ferricapiens]|uniref:ATP-binding protein n=1 Tax=Rhodoligotrophos ferricapiens TaxID=3069264 RepID=UPI00315C7127
MFPFGRPTAMSLTATRVFSSNPPLDLTLESAFFSRLKMRNGTFKFTKPSRFAEVDRWLLPFAKDRIGADSAVLDIAASTALTTIELMDALAVQGMSPRRVIATDLFIDAHLVDVAPGIRVLCDPDGWPLHYELAGFGIRAWRRRLDLITLAAVPLMLARAGLGPRLRRLIAEGRSHPVRMQSRALSGRNIELVANDIFVREPRFVGAFDFIRAANILNLGYFDERRLRTAIANIRAYCREPGALVLIVRTGDAHHDGTLFELDRSGGFSVVARLGRGAEIEPLVLQGNVKRAGCCE